MTDRTGVVVSRDGGTLRVSMPAARNPWFMVSALAFGVPWLVAVVVGAFIGARNFPDERTALVWVFVALAVLALTGLLDALAVATIWLGLYALVGRETLVISREGALVRRNAGPLGWPIKLRRGLLDGVLRLDSARAPGRVPHPTIELNLGRTRARIGAGISAEEADQLADTISEFIAQTAPAAGRPARTPASAPAPDPRPEHLVR